MDELRELRSEVKEFFRRHTFGVVAFSFLAFSFFLGTRLGHLLRLPIFCDEAIYIRWAQIAWHDASMRFISLTDGKQPLHTWLMIPFLKFFADPLFAGRALSVLTGVGILFLMVAGGAVFLAKKEAALWGALLVIFSPYLLFFNRMALAESLLTFFGLGAFFLSYFLGKARRLDLALIAGVWLGLGLLVKSTAWFFLILFPFSAAFIFQDVSGKKIKKEIAKFFALYLLVVIIAVAINNIQRLSPWMHMIGEKNKTFAVPLGEALKEPKRFFYNLQLATAWFWRYLTPPLFIASLWGLFLLLRENFLKGAFLGVWFLVPFFAESLIARIFTSRYLAFLAPFLLLGGVFFFIKAYSFWKKAKRQRWQRAILIFLGLAFLPAIKMDYQLLWHPETFPFTKTDRGYLEGWTAGYGLKETAAKMAIEAKDKKITIGTEGTFGLLPQGLEIYLAGQKNITVSGYYPLPSLPPTELVEKVKAGEKAYFLVNNTPGDFRNEKLVLIKEYPKVNDSGSLRLYEVVVKN